MAEPYPSTPDARYFLVRGRLWRKSNPNLSKGDREQLVAELMNARRAINSARRTGDDKLLAKARAAVDAAKVALGERGPVWWADGSPDYNMRMAKNTPYRDWFERLSQTGNQPGVR